MRRRRGVWTSPAFVADGQTTAAVVAVAPDGRVRLGGLALVFRDDCADGSLVKLVPS